jgi:hypothetical protein
MRPRQEPQATGIRQPRAARSFGASKGAPLPDAWQRIVIEQGSELAKAQAELKRCALRIPLRAHGARIEMVGQGGDRDCGDEGCRGARAAGGR